MYTFSSKLKTLSFILMILGILGIGYGFLTAPKTIQDVEKILAAEESEHGAHGASADQKHESMDHSNMNHEENHVAVADAKAETAMTATSIDAQVNITSDSINKNTDTLSVAIVPAVNNADQHAMNDGAHAMKDKHVVADDHATHEKHLEHVLHQLQNKPWAALYVACIFFMLISLGVLAFYAIQQVSQAGWSPVLFRVMQGISAYLPVGSIIFFIILILCGMHFNHLFPWMAEGVTDPLSPHYDKLIANKAGYLNVTAWLIRAAIFLTGWSLYWYFSRKNCLAQEASNDNLNYKKNFKLSAGFLVFFIVTESIMSWDWIMSIDPHWFSTLFGWYVFSSFFVTGITVICMVSLYLKSRGYLEYVNTSHIHDLAKFMFGFSIFWTYLWFSQFMLIWYANIPEEVTYFITRIELYNLPFFGAVVMNFVFPILILVNTDFKRITWILLLASIVIVAGHYIDFFNMIMPSAVGDRWFIGVAEIGSVFFFLGLFIFVVFTALTKSPLLPKRNPFIEESKHFHY